MKKIYLLAAMALIMVGCSSDDEGNYLADELLAGTKWRYGTFHDDDYLDQEPSTSVDISTSHDKFLEEYFPGVELICTIGEVSSTEDKDISQGENLQSRAKLTFTNSECIYYSDEGFSYTTVEVIRHYSQTTTYVEQSYTSTVNPDLSLEVTKDAIYICRMVAAVTGPYKDMYVYIRLDNFQHTKTWDETVSSDTEESCINPKEEIFSYQRNGNEVILTNSGKKWIGMLDTDAWTLSFVHIVSEKKEIPTFRLK